MNMVSNTIFILNLTGQLLCAVGASHAYCVVAFSVVLWSCDKTRQFQNSLSPPPHYQKK